MLEKTKKHSFKLGDKTLEIEFGRLAGQANGAVLTKLGETTVLTTAVMSKNPKEGGDYFPLVVDYEEKFYAKGKILGSRFVRREGRPSEEAILTARLIDRAIRPRFDQRARNEVQVVSTVLSIDQENDPDVPAVIGASLALSTSDIPWDGPVGTVRIAQIKDNWKISPGFNERQTSDLDIIVSGKEEKINMIEAGAKEISEAQLIKTLKIAQEEIRRQVKEQKKIIEELRPQKTDILIENPDENLKNLINSFLNEAQKLEKALYEKQKNQRISNLTALKDELFEYLKTQNIENLKLADQIFEEAINETVHKNIIEKERRPDGRALDKIRSLDIEVGILPRTHGSGLFQRGETQVLSTVTLGAPGDEQIIEGMEISEPKHFIHHYNFPPFSVGEVGRMASPGRREIGHGALAERALKSLVPQKEEFPYTIRTVSEVLSSNGSSSMASVCAATLALMDAGVPIKTPAAGIAMGLMLDKEGNYKILTDIQGPEDHHGDMDFKIAGTKTGITALQMDVKIEGVDIKILEETLNQAKKARLEILEALTDKIPSPRQELSVLAPRIITLQVAPDKIRDIIGPGGKTINEIIAKTGAVIDIEDSGLVFITAENKESAQKTQALIENLVREYKVGEIVEGRVTQIFDFGAVVEFGPNKDGLVHISELAPRRVNKVEDVVKIGDVIKVKIKRIENGKTSLSLKDLSEQKRL